MVNIFLSCSSKDHNTIEIIIDALKSLPDNYKLIYFLQPYKNNTPMQEIMESLCKADLFIVFITNNSLDSEFVQYELKEAIELSNLRKIKEICPIILDNNIDVNLDCRIPWFIKNCAIHHSKSPTIATQIAKNFILKYKEA